MIIPLFEQISCRDVKDDVALIEATARIYSETFSTIASSYGFEKGNEVASEAVRGYINLLTSE